MTLLQQYVKKERKELREQGVQVHVYGELDQLARGPRTAVREIEEATRGGRALQLNLMISYGARAEILRAARELAREAAAGELDPETIDEARFTGHLFTADLPDPDLLIRTSGEQRISNFMLWQIAYAELYMTPTLWPDFTRRDLFDAILEYQSRDRRFGRVGAG
jgi:undecaprenyl diphosphate synthase